MKPTFNPHAVRIRKARFGAHIGKHGRQLALAVTVVALAGTALTLGERHTRVAMGLGGLSLLLLALTAWLYWDIAVLKALKPGVGKSLDEVLEAGLVARLPWPASPRQIWDACLPDWQASFVLVRLAIRPDDIAPHLSQETAAGEAVWSMALALAQHYQADDLNAGLLVTAILTSDPTLEPLLAQLKLKASDVGVVYDWLERLLDLERIETPLYGGVARDWASGFTPSLDRFASNYSQQIQSGGHHFGSLAESPIIDQLMTTLGSGGAGVALVGAPGAGKTSTVYALAQRLIEGDGGNLAYKQIYSLSASLIISAGQQQGDIERIFLTILSEAIASGNIILALDDAELFFSQGTGALDLGKVLLPLVEGRRLPLILTLNPSDWQRLIATYPSLASALTPVMMTEPDQAHVIDILADTALGLEARSKVIFQYEALVEAYRLAGRYLTEQAYPGRAIKLLELAANHPISKIVNARSVQQAVEGSLGVKVAQAQGPESSMLLNLEDRIHQRMINQTRAVSVVASALRRARAGVANPKRPLGSFLFLGPTGVGKTELARSLAAIYYGGETNLTRLDLSEYQQPGDVERLLTADSTFLTAVRQQPFCVVLLDELEKAHPNFLNLLLQLLDEGKLTDTQGRAVSFKDAIVIATSNAGADEIRRHIEAGEDLESFEQAFTDQLISSGSFKPELLNRFDEIVLFRPLNEAELGQVVRLLIGEVNKTLANQNISVTLTDEAITGLVKAGYDPRLGARPMRRMVQRTVEDAVAAKILQGQTHPGDTITLGSDILKTN